MNQIERTYPQQAYEPEKGLTVKDNIIYTALGVAVAGGILFIGNKLYHNLVSGLEERKSLDTDSSANIAKRIKMSFDNDGWWGTDEDALRQILREIPSQEIWQETGISYQRLYATPLMKDMQDELTSSEYAEMMSIIAGKPSKVGQQIPSQVQYENWAKRLKLAFDYTVWGFPATDEEAIKIVFTEIPSQSAFVQVGQAYAKLFGYNLMEELKSEMWDYTDYMKIITSKQQ